MTVSPTNQRTTCRRVENLSVGCRQTFLGVDRSFEARFNPEELKTASEDELAPVEHARNDEATNRGYANSETNARTADRTLGLGTLIGSVAQITGNRYSYETIELFKAVSARLDCEREAARAQAGDSQTGKIESCIVELRLSQLANESDRRFFNSGPTKLQLPSKTVVRLCQLAARQLADNAEFRRLVSDLRDQSTKPNSPARSSGATTKDALRMTNL
jgi:hypothetical protein